MAEQAPALRVFKIKLPMRLRTSSKKKQALNLNVYRNLHFRSLSAQKNKFAKIAKKLLQDIPPLGVITLHYEVFPGSKRRLDIMNVGAIVDKYFSDSLTEVGVIEDDDYHNIPKVSFTFGGLVKSEYILVTITEIEPRKMPMRVLLDEQDIQRALTTYISTLNIPNASGVKLEADSHGVITAEIVFLVESPHDPIMPPSNIPQGGEPEESSEEGSKPTRRKRRTKAEMAADAAKETANVATPVQDNTDVGSGGDTSTAEGEAAETFDTSGTLKGENEPKSNSRKNLFGDKATPSSEDNGSAEATPGDTPEPVEDKPKRGSIFDA